MRKGDEGQVRDALVMHIPTDHLTITVLGQPGLYLGRLSSIIDKYDNKT